MPPPRANGALREQYFHARVRALRLHPEVWRQVPNGITRPMLATNAGAVACWRDVVQFLKDYGLVSPVTMPFDVNVPKLIRAVRELET